ncbi:hypothetical protein GNF10_17395 [Nostoc sp. UCD121]|nr:hypothetical protein [Nostoc sp. UCD121]MBC1296196.1 hypothetical protein [Nostoc sp. UCD122]
MSLLSTIGTRIDVVFPPFQPGCQVVLVGPPLLIFIASIACYKAILQSNPQSPTPNKMRSRS